MHCAQCGHRNRDSARYCASCGQPLEQVFGLTALTQNCLHCATTNRAQARYCYQCGTNLASNSAPESAFPLSLPAVPLATSEPRDLSYTPPPPLTIPQSVVATNKLGQLMAFGAGIVAALAVGFIGYQIKSSLGVFLIILGPAIMGALTSFIFLLAYSWLARLRPVSPLSPNQALATVFLLGLLCYASTFYYEYRATITMLEQEGYKNVPQRLPFATFLSVKAETGTAISFRSSQNKTPVNGQGIYLLWLVEEAAAGFGGYWTLTKMIAGT